MSAGKNKEELFYTLAFETIFYSAASKPVFLNLEKVIFTPALQPGDSESV